VSPCGVADIRFNARDASFAVVTQDGFVGRYELPSFKVLKEGIPEKGIEYRSCDFL
jgi:hypothetical protein